MPYSLDGAAGAGVVAALVTLFALAVAMFLERSLRINVIPFLGSPFPLPGWLKDLTGLALYGGLSIVFALGYGALYSALEIESNVIEWGVLFGLLHWAITGALLVQVVRVHPRVRDGSILDPGPFLINLSGINGFGFLVLHILFGMTAGFFYDALR